MLHKGASAVPFDRTPVHDSFLIEPEPGVRGEPFTFHASVMH
jgi:hypothetical protein